MVLWFIFSIVNTASSFKLQAASEQPVIAICVFLLVA
jgi:hypothetical protein